MYTVKSKYVARVCFVRYSSTLASTRKAFSYYYYFSQWTNKCTINWQIM